MIRRVYLDSNIIISAFSGESERENASLLLNVIEAVGTKDAAPLVTSELTLAEVLVRPLRTGLDKLIGSMDNVLTSSTWLDVVPINRRVIFGSAWVRSQYPAIKLPDAIHVATAIASGCSHLLTADTGLAGEYVVRHWRLGETSSSSAVTVMRPDVPTLESIITWLST